MENKKLWRNFVMGVTAEKKSLWDGEHHMRVVVCLIACNYISRAPFAPNMLPHTYGATLQLIFSPFYFYCNPSLHISPELHTKLIGS